MNIYISGISGTGMGPLALLAKSAGFEVSGSDRASGPVLNDLKQAEIPTEISSQDGTFLQKIHQTTPIDWFVYTSSLPKDHPELQLATSLGIKTSKRDEFLNFLLEQKQLKLIAVAGTHGKTTTTAMLVWAAKQLHLPVSYLVGTTLNFAPSGHFDPNSQYFFYEADEYDRNFLHFHPYLALITSLDYDHVDIYPTPEDYQAAFRQFEAQSQQVIKEIAPDPRLSLSGAVRRQDATLALSALKIAFPDLPEAKIINVLNQFPGANRRFERLTDGVYSDYAHHPQEIAATLQIASEEAQKLAKKGIVVIYQPHQNTRQHQVKSGYKTAFSHIDQLFWLPTFLTREDPNLPLISPAEFIKNLQNPAIATSANLDSNLATTLKNYQKSGYLILLLSAGPADSWFRDLFLL